MRSYLVLAKHALLSAVGVIAVGLYLQACGSTSNDRGPISLDDLPGAMADAYCNNVGPCCERAGLPLDFEKCHSDVEANVRSIYAPKGKSPNVDYNPNAARACVDAYATAVKGCVRDDGSVVTVCNHMFIGKLELGQPCGYDGECVAGSFCEVPEDGASRPVCTVRVHGKEGEACKETCTQVYDFSDYGDLFCFSGGPSGTEGGKGPARCFTNDGLSCDGITWTCAALPELGQPCPGSTAICAGDAFCNNGVCAAKTTSGPCGQLGDGCTASAYCDGTRQCTPRKPTGSPCNEDSECLSTDFCEQGTCKTRTFATPGFCGGS